MARESNPEKLPTQRNESARRPSDTGLRRRTNENFQRPLPLKPPPDPFGEHIITVNPSGSSPRPKPGTLGRRFGQPPASCLSTSGSTSTRAKPQEPITTPSWHWTPPCKFRTGRSQATAGKIAPPGRLSPRGYPKVSKRSRPLTPSPSTRGTHHQPAYKSTPTATGRTNAQNSLSDRAEKSR